MQEMQIALAAEETARECERVYAKCCNSGKEYENINYHSRAVRALEKSSRFILRFTAGKVVR